MHAGCCAAFADARSLLVRRPTYRPRRVAVVSSSTLERRAFLGPDVVVASSSCPLISVLVLVLTSRLLPGQGARNDEQETERAGVVPSGLRVKETKHPSRGGNPYGPDMRMLVLTLHEKEGIDHLKNDIGLAALRRDKKFPCFATCKSWIEQNRQLGHVRPKKATGNKQTRREVNGVDLYNLALYRKYNPKAYIDEVRAYVHNRNPANKPYSKSQIHRAETRLGLTRKTGSTTSTKAYLAINLQKRRQYWNEPYPLGIRGVCTNDVIDLDEARFTLVSMNRKRGKTVTFHRCDSQGMYRKGEPGTNLLCAVGGDGTTPISYHEQYSAGGTIPTCWVYLAT